MVTKRPTPTSTKAVQRVFKLEAGICKNGSKTFKWSRDNGSIAARTTFRKGGVIIIAPTTADSITVEFLERGAYVIRFGDGLHGSRPRTAKANYAEREQSIKVFQVPHGSEVTVRASALSGLQRKKAKH